MGERFYVTKKQVVEYIRLNLSKFNSIAEFKMELKTVIADLKEPIGYNKAQIKLFSRVLERLEEKYQS